MKRVILLVFILCFALFVFSQNYSDKIRSDSLYRKYEFHNSTDIGFGLGIDYGGILGIKAGYSPIKHLNLFIAGGLQLSGFGWQVGSMGYIMPKTTKNMVRPYFKVMYGVNASIYVDGTDEYNKLYHGITVGSGSEFRFGKKKKHGFNVELSYPIRTKEFYDDQDKLKNDPRIEDFQELVPISISMGYHMEF